MATIGDLERANAELRAAVEARLAKTTPQCCYTADTTKFEADLKRAAESVAYASSMAASLAGCKPAQEAAAACLSDRPPATVELPADVPEEYREAHAGSSFAVAVPQQPAEFRITPVGSSVAPEQLDAIWAAARAKAAAAVRGDTPPEPLEVEEFRAGESEAYADWTAGRQPAVRIIGLAGHIGSGKSAAAAMIPGAIHLQWADAIYRGLAAMLDIPEEVLRHRDGKEEAIQLDDIMVVSRHLTRTLGTEWGRDCVSEKLWVTLALRRVRKIRLATGRKVFAICGTRFPNEVAACDEVWWIDRPGIAVGDHKSDVSLTREQCDRIIVNDGSIEKLRHNVEAAWNDFLKASAVAEALKSRQVNTRTMVVGAE